MSSKCDGKLIKPYRRTDGTRVVSHCRQSINTVLNDNRRKVSQLKRILKVSNDTLQNIENKLKIVKQPMSNKNMVQKLQQALNMSITSKSTPELKSLLENQLQMLNEQRLHYKDDDTLKNAVSDIESKMNLLHEFMVRIESHLSKSKLNDVRDRSEDIDNLLEEKKQFKQEHERMLSTLNEIKEKNLYLDQQLNELEKEKNALVSKVSSIPDLENENAELKRRIEELRDQGVNTQQLDKKLDDQQANLDKIKQLTDSKRDIQHKLDELESSKAQFQQQLDEKEQALQKQKEELDMLRTKSVELDSSMNQSSNDSKIKELEDLVKSKENENQVLRDKLDSMDKNANSELLQKQLDERDSQLNDMKNKEIELRQSIEKLVSEKNDAMERLNALRTSTAETDVETNLNKQISELEKRINEVNLEKQKLNDAKEQVESDLAKKDARISELESKLDSSEKQYKDLNERIGSLKKEQSSILSSAIDELQSKKSELEQKLSKSRQEKQDVEGQLEEKDRQMSKLRDEVKMRDNSISTLQLEKDSKDTSNMNEKEQLLQQIKDKSSTNDGLQKTLEKLRTEKNQLEQTLLNLKSDRDTLATEKSRLDQVDANNRSLRDELVKKQALIDALNKDKEQLESDKKNLQDNVGNAEELESSFSQEKQDLVQKINDLSAQHDTDQRKLSELNELKHKSKEDSGKIMTLTKSLNESGSKEQEWASKLIRVEHELKEARVNHEKIVREKNAIMEEKNTALIAQKPVQDKVEQLTIELNSREDTIKNLKEKNKMLEIQQTSSMTDSMKKLESSLSDKETKLSELQRLVDEMRLKVKHMDSLEKDKKDLETKLVLSTKNNEKYIEEIGQLTDEVVASKAEITLVKNQMVDLVRTIEKNQELESKVLITEDEVKRNLASKDKIIEDLTKEKNKLQVDLRELVLSKDKELSKLKKDKEKEINELQEVVRAREERIKILDEASVRQEEMMTKNTTLESSLAELQEKYEDLKLLQEQQSKKAEEEKSSSKDEATTISQQLADTKKQLDIVNLQLKQAKEQEEVQKKLVQKLMKQLEEKDAFVKQKIKDFENILDEKNRELDNLKEDRDKASKEYTSLKVSLDESLLMLMKASEILKSKDDLSDVADKIMINVTKLKNNVTEDLVDFTPTKVSEYEEDKTLYEHEENPVESYDKIYKQYEDILVELNVVQNYYIDILKEVDSKLISQENTNIQTDNEGIILIYSFLTTVLFHLCKTYIRIPFVLRMISLPDIDLTPAENTKIKKTIIDSLYIKDPLLGVDGSEVNEVLKTINSVLYDTYMKKVNSNVSGLRIDIMAYYMVKFVYEIKDTTRTTTEYNSFLRMIDNFSQDVLKKLRSIMYASIGDTKKQLSYLDKIKTQSITKLTTAHNESNKVVTFVKIRIDGERATFMNKRFQTDAYMLSKAENKSRKELRLKYSDFDYRKGYGEDSGELNMGNSDFKTNGFRFYTKNGAPACDLNEIKYNHEFYFGPFSQIYTPDQSALDITREVTFVNNIERKLREGKPVCIIGYGASGSGKTSTLVYLSYYKKGDSAPTTQNGILAELSNKMTDMFDGCSIQVYEFEGNIDGDEKSAVNDYLMRKYPGPVTNKVLMSDNKTSLTVYNKQAEEDRNKMDPNDTTNTCFEYEIKSVDTVRQWVKKDTNRYTAVPVSEEEYNTIDSKSRYKKDGKWYKVMLDPYKSDKEISEDEYKQLKPGQGYEQYGKFFKVVPDAEKKFIPMASDIANFMDNKRNIAATANNPVSSRSHVVIFINYKESKTKKQSTLVLCDFAGVENRFDCDSESVLSKLATIPTKKTANNKPEEQIPYYESRIGDTKRKNYTKFVDINGSELLSKASSISSDVKDNIDFILNNMSKSPLSNIEMKKAELLFQQQYPPSQMVSITQFVDRLVMVKKIQDKLNQKEISSIMIGANKIEQWNAVYKKNDPVYKETKFSASDVIFKLTKNQYGLTSKLIMDGPNEWLDIKPLAPIDVTMNGESVFVSKLLYLANVYGSELFKKYKSDEERKNGLVVMQYFFEIMSGVTEKNVQKTTSSVDYNYTVDKLASMFAKKICVDRVKEGLYINDSLLQLRKFIGKLVKSQSNGYAPFIDKCLPLQCNPFYKDCFGLNEYDDDQSLADPNISSLAQQIMKAPNYSDMTFCIMCVINLSTGANNPPPAPYIDITNLMVEFERMKMVKQQLFMSKRIIQKNIKEQLEVEFNGALMSNAYKVDQNVLDQLSKNPLLDTPLSDKFQKTIRDKCNKLTESDVMSADYLTDLENLIDEVNKSNAITTIGTLQFTDTMAKFGTSQMTCNLLAKNKFSYDTNIVKTINVDGAKEIYSSLSLLKIKGVLTQEQLEKEYKPFVGLYNPFPPKTPPPKGKK